MRITLLLHLPWWTHPGESRNQRADDVPFSPCSESLSENLTFPSRPLASLVASKVYYHLGNLDEALSFALGAGKLFDVGQTGDGGPTEREYVETVICESGLQKEVVAGMVT